jgi:hypothetical protein
MGFGDVLGKVKELVQGRKSINITKGKTPNEVELESYQRRDYQDLIKKKVHEYRIKDNEKMFLGSSFEHTNTVLNPTGKKKAKRMPERNVFWR